MFNLTYKKRNANQDYSVIQFLKLSDWHNSKTLIMHAVCESMMKQAFTHIASENINWYSC